MARAPDGFGFDLTAAMSVRLGCVLWWSVCTSLGIEAAQDADVVGLLQHHVEVDRAEGVSVSSAASEIDAHEETRCHYAYLEGVAHGSETPKDQLFSLGQASTASSDMQAFGDCSAAFHDGVQHYAEVALAAGAARDGNGASVPPTASNTTPVSHLSGVVSAGSLHAVSKQHCNDTTKGDVAFSHTNVTEGIIAINGVRAKNYTVVPPIAQPFQAASHDAFVGHTKQVKMTVLGCVLFGGIIVFEIFHYRAVDIDFSSSFKTMDDVLLDASRSSIGPYVGAARLWLMYLNECRALAVTFVTAIVLMICFSQYCNTLSLVWVSAFWKDVQSWAQHRNIEFLGQWQAMLVQKLWIIFMTTFCMAYRSYIQSMFVIHVRTAVTHRYTCQWLNDHVFYRLELYRLLEHGCADNPDQRIQEDVNSFIDGTIEIVTSLVSNVIQFFVFSATVYRMSPKDAWGVPGLHVPGWLLWTVIVYISVSTFIITSFSAKIEVITNARQRSEADFRWELTTVRRNTESIALMRSVDLHEGRLRQRFDMVRRSVWEGMFVSKRYSVVNMFFSHCEMVIILLLLGPSFMRGDIDVGTLMATNRATGLLTESLFWFAHMYAIISQWKASTDRLVRFEEAMSRTVKEGGGAKLVERQGGGVQLEDLKMWAPMPASLADKLASDGVPPCERQGVPLLERVNLTMDAGTRVLVTGTSGAGKSTLLRVLSGAWPFASGQAAMLGGEAGSIFFPTDVFILPGSLRQAVAYPVAAAAEPPSAEKPGNVDDDRILKSLDLVGLGALANEGLDTERDWSLALSAGQKSRLSLARCVYHRPALAALDEPVAHLDQPARAPLLKAVLDSLPPEAVVIVISHDLSPEIGALFKSRLQVDPIEKTLVPVKH